MNKFIFYAEVQHIFVFCSKDNANREQNKMNKFIFYAEVPLIFVFCSKDKVFRRINNRIFQYIYYLKDYPGEVEPVLYFCQPEDMKKGCLSAMGGSLILCFV